jgi:hypothetical protein
LREVVDDALDIVGETDGVKVHEEPEVVSGHSEIGEDLGVMDWEECADSFQFDHERILHE